jgi:hypothetical protein
VLIDAAARGDSVSAALQLFEQLANGSVGLQPNGLSLCTMAAAFRDAGDWTQALHTLDRANEFGLATSPEVVRKSRLSIAFSFLSG